MAKEIKNYKILENKPLQSLEEITKHCETCTFTSNETISYYNSCALKFWISNNSSVVLANSRGSKIDLDALQILLFQFAATKEQKDHQRIVSKLLKKTGINFDIDRTLFYLDGNGRKIKLRPWIYALIAGHVNNKLRIIIKHGADVNRISNCANLYNNYNPIDQITPLHVCANRGEDKINFTAAKLLLRAGAKIETVYYRDGVKTNIYRHCLDALRLKLQRGDATNNLRKFIGLLKIWKYSINVIFRRLGKHRRRKLIDVLNLLFDFHKLDCNLLSIISEYTIPVTIVKI